MKALVYTAPHSLAFRDEPDPVRTWERFSFASKPSASAARTCMPIMVTTPGARRRSSSPRGCGSDRRRTPRWRAGDNQPPGRRSDLPHRHRRPAPPVTVAPDHFHAAARCAFAEFVRIPERNIVAIPDSLPVEHARSPNPLRCPGMRLWLGPRSYSSPLRAPAWPSSAVGPSPCAALVSRLFGALDIRIGEPNPLRRQTIANGEGFVAYEPGTSGEPAENSVDLVIDAVGARASRAAACAMVRPAASSSMPAAAGPRGPRHPQDHPSGGDADRHLLLHASRFRA